MLINYFFQFFAQQHFKKTSIGTKLVRIFLYHYDTLQAQKRTYFFKQNHNFINTVRFPLNFSIVVITLYFVF